MRHAVVVCEPPVDEEAVAAIAKMTAYDVRLRLGGVLPAILCWTSDLDEAVRIQKAIGPGAMTIDPSMVTPSDRMPRVRRFAFEPDRFKANDRDEGIAYANITALVRAATVTTVLRRTREREVVYRAPSRTRTVEEVEHFRNESAASTLLYICSADQAPILLVSHEAKYVSLGSAMRSTEHDNFLVVIQELRTRAPMAIYDERFAERPHDSNKLAVVHGNDHVDARNDNSLDLLVHALARWLTRETGGPYRNLPGAPDA